MEMRAKATHSIEYAQNFTIGILLVQVPLLLLPLPLFSVVVEVLKSTVHVQLKSCIEHIGFPFSLYSLCISQQGEKLEHQELQDHLWSGS